MKTVFRDYLTLLLPYIGAWEEGAHTLAYRQLAYTYRLLRHRTPQSLK